MKRLALVLALGALLMAGVAVGAQAPALSYNGHEIEPDPDLGPVQCVVVARDELRHEDLDGVTSEVTVHGAIIVDDEAHDWLLAGVVEQAAKGAWNLMPGDDCSRALGRG